MCRLVQGADFASLGFTYAAPGAARAADCDFSVLGTGSSFATVRITVQNVPAKAVTGGGRLTKVSGVSVRSFRYDRSDRSCLRVLELPKRSGLTTVNVVTLDTGAGEAKTCRLSDVALAPFAAAAAQRAPLVLRLKVPTLFSVDGCRAAGAAKLRSLPLLSGTTMARIGYDTGCLLTGSKGNLALATGLLLGTSDDRLGSPISYDNHIYLGTDPSSGFCTLTSKQANDEFVVGSYYGNGEAVTDTTCAQVGQALGRYLDVLGLR